MKKIKLILLLAFIQLNSISAQEKNLKLVQILTIDSTIYHNASDGITNASYTVPANRYWKIENLTLNPTSGSMASFGINNVRIWFNPASVISTITGTTYQGPPIWCKPGNTLQVWPAFQNTFGNYSYRIVIFEFMLE
jgi:hypothetical protein